MTGAARPRETLVGLLRSLGSDKEVGYFERRRCRAVYITDSYRATAVLTLERDVPYLDRFAVTRQAQGEGIGGSLWARLTTEHPRLFWRARADNPIRAWYFDRAHGCVRHDDWTVFWRGLSGFEEVRACVEHALRLPDTLQRHGVADVLPVAPEER